MKRLLFFLLPCFICFFSTTAFAHTVEDTHFVQKKQKNQYTVMPSLGASTLVLGVAPNETVGIGPLAALDIAFKKANSGFTFFTRIDTAAWFALSRYREEGDSRLLMLPVMCLHGMLGYSHTFTNNFAIAAGIGLGAAFSPMQYFIPLTPIPGISTYLAFTQFLNEKFGISIAALNSFIIIPFGSYRKPDGSLGHGYLWTDVCTISIGPCFRW